MSQLLFHGSDAIDMIVNAPTAGFLPLLAGSSTGALYGDGTYFARDARCGGCLLPPAPRRALAFRDPGVLVGVALPASRPGPLNPRHPSVRPPPPHLVRRYSDDYAKVLPTGQKQLIVAQVALGRSTAGARGMKICPMLPGEKYVRFDSLVNDEADPAIFVVQHSSQAYPAYVITYH
jgi:hypothetical protein